MDREGSRIFKLAALLACAALALAASPALAKKKKKKPAGLGAVSTVTATGNTVSAIGQYSTANATCPTGTQAVGGGYSAPFDATNQLAVTDSFRSSPQTWTVIAAWGSEGSGAVAAQAYCRRTSKSISDVTGTGGIEGGSFSAGSTSATCPANTQLIGGGFQSTKGSSATTIEVAVVESNLSTGPGVWGIAAVNNGTQPETVTAHAYCVSHIRPPLQLNATTSQAAGRFGTVTSSTPSCPVPKKAKHRKKGKKKKKKPRQFLSAGGFATPPATDGDVAPVPLQSMVGPSGGWLAQAANAADNTSSLPVTAQGICA